MSRSDSTVPGEHVESIRLWVEHGPEQATGLWCSVAPAATERQELGAISATHTHVSILNMVN
jgi:hypothetical protein